MKLLIDLGNSRCKYASVEGQRITVHEAFAITEIDNLSISLKRDLPVKPEATYAISVVNQNINDRVAEIIVNTWGHSPIFLNQQMPVGGLSSDYQAPQLGIDRLSAIVAAWRRLTRSAIIVDYGTAITIDYIDHQGVHRGGVIVPGYELMRSALSVGTAQLEHFVNNKDVIDIFALNTKDAISGGCRSAVEATVCQVVQAMRAATDTDTPVLATGGGIGLLASIAPHIDGLSVIETLVFEGMLVLIEE